MGSADYIQALLKLAASLRDSAVMRGRRGLPIFNYDIDTCIGSNVREFTRKLVI